MIHSNISQNKFYKSLDKKIALCLDKARELNENTACGRYELAEGCYVNVSSYSAKEIEDAVAETHNVYADIQIILDGEEFIGYSKTSLLSPISDYDEKSDIRFWKGEIALLPMQKGDWALFMPGEAHAPGLKKSNVKVKKAVFKIPY